MKKFVVLGMSLALALFSYCKRCGYVGTVATRSRSPVFFNGRGAWRTFAQRRASDKNSGPSKIMVVESPSKATSIGKFLGSSYDVIPSYGHVRDLRAKPGSVTISDEVKMIWDVSTRGKKFIDELASKIESDDVKTLYLATDPDREGEAIAWHVRDMLYEKFPQLKNDGSLQVVRVAFNEITPNAVEKAIDSGRDIDIRLVDAYRARRSLDYLYGFSLSPVLWKKLPKAKSAGRVQSVALRLIVEREQEREGFESEKWFDVNAQLKTKDHGAIDASITKLDGKKINSKRPFNSEESAVKASKIVHEAQTFTLQTMTKRQSKTRPPAPFTTSTLQQAASTRLGMGVSKVMSVAQKLYEGDGSGKGFITYMRTDSPTISAGAVKDIRKFLEENFNADALTDRARVYRSKSKSAQEAHEAIRPVDISLTPEQLKGRLDASELKLYKLIWQRTLASQMADSINDVYTPLFLGETDDGSHSVELASKLVVVVNPGYNVVWGESSSESSAVDSGIRLIPGEICQVKKTEVKEKKSNPPPRYSEAALVKKLEELGIGRPSTYASIIKTLLTRDYIKSSKRQLVPTDAGRVLSSYLQTVFTNLVEYSFTADMEGSLDQISRGEANSIELLQPFVDELESLVDEASDMPREKVSEVIDSILAPSILGIRPDDIENVDMKNQADIVRRICPQCKKGVLKLELGRFGPYLGCSRYPECKCSIGLARVLSEGNNWRTAWEAGNFTIKRAEPVELGSDPETGLTVTAREGPYGAYVQLGEPTKAVKKVPRCKIPDGVEKDTIDLETALKLLETKRVATSSLGSAKIGSTTRSKSPRKSSSSSRRKSTK